MRKVFGKMGKKVTLMLLCCSLALTGINYNESKADAAENKIKSWLLSEGRPAYSSSVNGGDIAGYATDGKMDTQWGAQANLNDQWLDVDLGKTADISKIEIAWQNNASYGVVYDILVSEDEIEWKRIYSKEDGDGGEETAVYKKDGTTVDYTYFKDVISSVKGSGRYVRIKVKYSKSQYDSADHKGWGASIREVKIYGVGGVNKPESDAENLAKGKNVTVSSSEHPWWAQKELGGDNAVDEDYDTYWLSNGTNNEWFQVDLGKVYTLGKVEIQWQVEYGRIYELQLSEDGKDWKTYYRQIHGNGEDESISLYGNARYVKMKGISMGRGSGYSIREMKVYEYQEGDSKENQVIESLPESKKVSLGKGSYAINDVDMAQPREPKYVTKNIKTPIPSNDWWTSVIYTRLSDTMPALPFVYKYSENGIGMYYADGVYTRTDDGGMGADSKYFDLTIGSADIEGRASAKLDSYSDWMSNIIFSDDDTKKLETTIIKGSPFVYNKFASSDKAEITVNDPVKYFDGDNNEILLEDGEQVKTDHIGVEVHNISEAPGDGNKDQYHYYGIYVPENTVFTKVGSKLKVKLGNNENYMSVGILTEENDLDYMYDYAYAFVEKTDVNYNFNDETSMMETTYDVTTKLMRDGFKDKTIMCMMPHQWKYSDTKVTDKTYKSIRGTLKTVEGKRFSYSLKFQGVIPSFTEPVESESYNREEMVIYLKDFAESTARDYWVADPYWQGKKTHPIAMGILIAQQLGEYEIRDNLISVLKKILINWYTYDGPEEYPYYLYYHGSWGAISGDGGDHGMAINLSDHHFLWAYFIFPSAILASYDDEFRRDYGDMVELLIRDCMNPDKDDEMLPYMRNFDPYEGHSWAGGYGDNNSGNNQESASEATFAWAGLYLWGLVTENEKYKEAGIWGYTSEINAIEQYWFNYDNDNWDKDYGAGCVGMVWGLGYTNGTYFSGNPSCIYGIHMLPVTPALTYMGYKPEKAAEIYKAYEASQEKYQKKLATEGKSDPEGWFHILWPYLSLSNPERAAEKWKKEISDNTNSDGVYQGGNLPNDEMFNSYWFIQNMCAKGLMATDIWAVDYTGYEVFKKDGKYTATVWNPYNKNITVKFRNSNGITGQVTVAPHATVNADPFKVTDLSGETVPEVKNNEKTNVVPGVIEAEDYYTNFSCMKDNDSVEGGYIGWIDDGDSLIFDTDVKEAGDYIIEYRFISTSDDKVGEIKLESDKSDTPLAVTKLNDTKSWTTVKDKISLEKGRQKLKTYFIKGGFNFNWIKIYKVGTKPPVAESDDLTKADLSEYEEIDLSNATVSCSTEIGGNKAVNVIDKDYGTRWESESKDPQFIQLKLQKEESLAGIKLYWETAAAKNYTIDVSTDGENWTTAFTRKNGTGGAGYGDDLTGSGLESICFDKVYNGSYIRINTTVRTTGYGYSIYEIRAFKDKNESGTTEETTTGQYTKPVINGCQINATIQGMRTVYTVKENKDVKEAGLIYGLKKMAGKEEMQIDSKSSAVRYFKGTTKGVIDKKEDGTATYAMTMLFNTDSPEFFNADIMVRAYVKLADGSYAYSDVDEYSVYNIAHILYSNSLMKTKAAHDYLYNNILLRVNKEYKEIDYGIGKSTVIY